MVPNFMGYHIGIGKFTIRTDSGAHLLEEIEIDIHRLVGRAIERACLRGSIATAGIYRTAEKYQFGTLVLAPALTLKLACPHIFRSGEHLRGKCGKLLVFSRGLIVGL